MHEFSLAQSVIDTMLKTAQQNNVEKIKKVILKFGMFALVQEDQFRFCFDLIKSESDLTENTELEVVWMPGELKCESCDFEGEVDDLPEGHDFHPIFKCPSCKSYSTKIISGTETIIDSILV